MFLGLIRGKTDKVEQYHLVKTICPPESETEAGPFWTSFGGNSRAESLTGNSLRHHRQRQIVAVATFVVGLESVVADRYR
jgi:hypothetical protein